MKKRKKLLAAVLLTAVLTAIYCSYDLDVEEWEVPSSRLPSAFDGTRIVLLTDFHGQWLDKGRDRLLAAVAEARPDIIAISGDLADESTDRTQLDPVLRGLAAMAPTYYVTGNHEWGRDDTEDLLSQLAATGITLLRNDYTLLERDGQTLVLAGTEDPNAYADMKTPHQLVDEIRDTLPTDPYICMLYHRNNSLALWSSLEVDTVLTGHGHGGVIRLPFVGGLLGVERNFFPKDCEGLYTTGRTTLAVSRGLGGIRLWNRPHLPVLILRKI